MATSTFRSRGRMFSPALEEDENADRWVLSYADFITLLFAFFVVMYSISSVNDGKFRVLSESMVTVFQEQSILPAPVDLGGGMPGLVRAPGDDTDGAPERVLEAVALDDFPVPAAEIDPRDLRSENLAKKVEHVLKGAIEMEQVNVRESENWTEVQLDSEFMFGSGQARFSAAATGILEKVVTLLHDTDTPIRVEGFTDNVPLNGGQYGSNWELSAARAANVVNAFAEAGVAPARMSATGFGDLHPVADNATEDGRRKNRRVIVAIAKHRAVGDASVSVAAAEAAPSQAVEQLPLRTLQRVSELPGPAVISL